MDPLTTLSAKRQPDRARTRPTMRDVAALAGVSLKTVSRVINDEPAVSTAVRERVQRAIVQLEFRPNLTASNLRRTGGKTATLGLVLEDLANPYSAAIIRAVEDTARPRGVTVVAGSVDEDPVRERELIEDFIARRVDGLIVVPAATDHSYLVLERRSGLPMVFVDRPPRNLEADTVVADNRAGAGEAVAHLAGLGHRRIAFIGDLPSIWTAAERHDGYLEAMRSASLDHDGLVRRGARGVEAAAAAVADLLATDDPPTALFAAQNLLTVGAFAALRRLGRRADIALVGFDDFPLADLLDPGVTVVAQDPLALGRHAAEILFRRLDGDQGPTTMSVLPTHLIERGSGEIRPPR